MVRVKICGITRLEDARLAISLGAHALGFNFYEKSPRCLSPSDAWSILRRLPALVSTVGVFVNWDDSSIIALAKSLRLGAVQLHGDESDVIVSRCAKFFPVIKALPTGSKFSLAELRHRQEHAGIRSRHKGRFASQLGNRVVQAALAIGCQRLGK